MLSATAKERILFLADFLDTLPVEKFDYGRWVGEDWQGAADLSCGTKACAAGWATTLQVFQDLGLILCHLCYDVHLKDDKCFSLDKDFAYASDRALMQVFDITDAQVLDLFYPNIYSEDQPNQGATPQKVAAYFRRYIQEEDE